MGSWQSRPTRADASTGDDHRSLRCRIPTTITFTNTTIFVVEICWFDYFGRRNGYHLLNPGNTFLQPTFLTHPWGMRFVDCATETPFPRLSSEFVPICAATGQSVVYPSSGADAAVVIMALFHLDWSPERHKKHYPGFRKTAKAMLLCHHRLRCNIMLGEEAATDPNLGDLPKVNRPGAHSLFFFN